MVRQLKIVNANIGAINRNTKLGIKINSFSILQFKCRLLTNQNTGRLIIVESTPITPMAWYYMVIWVVEFSSGGTKLERFLLKNQHIPKGNYWILRIGVVASCQKLGIILLIKWVNNWCYQKMAITKNVLLYLNSSIKKFRKIFDVENWVWKSDIGTFWHLPITSIRQIQWFHLTTVNF